MISSADDSKGTASSSSLSGKKPRIATTAEPLNPAGKYWKSIVTVLGTLQIAGILAGSGFIVKFAREDFLGVSAGNWDASQLGMLAGSFALTSATLLCEYVIHPEVAIPLIVLLAAFVLTDSLLKCKKPGLVGFLHLAAYLVLSVSFGVIFRVEQAPTLYLHDFLITSPKDQPNIPEQTPDYKETNNLVRLIFGSRVKEDPTRSTDFPILKGFKLTTQSAYDVLNAQYARSMLFCLIGWNFLFTSERTGRFKTHGAVVVAVFVLLLLMVTVMIPYTYGKLIHSTDLPSATVEYKDTSPNPKSDQNKHIEGPLLFQNDQTVAILWAKDGKTAVDYIPSPQVLGLRLHGTVDALTYVLGRQTLPKPLPPLT
ncbi:MAG: hypothetical protein ABSD67_05080 [Terracidiphilus sp.]|jgi:hypothetical protein